MKHLPTLKPSARCQRALARWGVLALALVVTLPAQIQAQDTADGVSLRPQWETGHVARYEFWNQRRQDTTVSFGGNTQAQGNTVESVGEVTWVVDEVRADGGAVCTMTLEWMTATFTPDEGEVADHDSRKSKGDIDEVQDLLKAMAGKPLKVTVNADGSIAKVDGIQAMRDACENPDMVPDELDFEETASDLATLPFTPATLDVGGRWEADFRWTHETGFLDQPWRYTLTSVDDIAGVRVAVVDGVAKKMKLDPSTMKEEMPADAPPVKIKLTDSGGESQVLFDLARHEAVGRNGVVRNTVTVEIPLPDGRKIVRTIEETNHSQLLRIAEQ